MNSNNAYLKNLIRNIIKEATEAEQDRPVAGPSTERLPKAYFMRDDLTKLIVDRMIELAPQGVSSQGDMVQLLNKALDETEQKLKGSIPNQDVMSDIDLSLNQVYRDLANVPYTSIWKQ